MLGKTLAILLLFCATARADITKVNYLQANPTLHYVNMYDVNGNKLDVEEGDFQQFGGVYYYYGQSDACGWITGANSPFCGFRVYSSPDMVNWTDRGLLFDPNSGSWQAKCAGTTSTYNGCWRPHMLFNAANNNYVLIFELFSAANSISEVEVFTCTSPTGGCTDVGPMASYVSGTYNDQAVYQDEQSTDAYIVWGSGGVVDVSVQKLNASYTDLTGGATTITGLAGEGGWIRHIGSHWMVGTGTLCPNCSSGTTLSYMSSTSALGPYSGLTTFSPSGACNSQILTLTKIVASGITTYLYVGDRFAGGANFGQSAPYMQPLTLTGDLFDTFTCSPSITIPGITSTGTYPTPAYGRSFDIDFMQNLNADFYDDCVVQNGGPFGHVPQIMQQFTPTVAALNSIGINIGQGVLPSCGPGPFGPGNCPGANGSLEIDVTTLDGSGNPATVLGSATYLPASLKFTSEFKIVPFGLTLTPSTKYAVVAKAVSNTQGCYVVSRAQPGSPLYGSNVAKYTTDGVTWNTLTNETIQISTIPLADAAKVPFSAVVH